MAAQSSEDQKADVATAHHHDAADGAGSKPQAVVHHRLAVVPIEDEARQGAVHVSLGWRSWLVVFVTCFAIMAQVFVVVAAGSVIAFIVRDVGDAALAGWIIQGPLLMQSVLSPIVGRLSDAVGRKLVAALPPLVAFAGAVVSARATNMHMLIGGGILIGTTLSTISIVQAIPSEILPLKYRALANGFAFVGGCVGGIPSLALLVSPNSGRNRVGTMGAGAVTNADAGGWRYIFWMQAAFHLATSLGLFLFYWPPAAAVSERPRLSARDIAWAVDPVGSLLFIASATLMLLALDWAAGAYPWSDAHVVAPLAVGLVLFVAFGLYEWKGRDDGLVAHVFFARDANFALSVFAFAVEGWIFYSAVNSITPQLVLNLGFETSAWKISVRQLSYGLTSLLFSLVVTWYSTRFRDLKTPLLVTWALFLIVAICYAAFQPGWDHVQIGLNVIGGIGQAGPLTLLVACVQFTAPHAFLSTATGLAFSARAIGGAFGSAVLDAIISGRLAAHYAPAVGAAATAAGLPPDSVPALLAALAAGGDGDGVAGASPAAWAAAVAESRVQYNEAYRLAWASIIPFVFLATVAVACLRGVGELMTEKVEATVERLGEGEGEKLAA
ncbi:major facilitator superfamily domain-containing protein [Lasiosphaeria miniovina]|uniref:Major facilitator superfamily domain-containing protein n=1 Tax=Lasiosphaeria miniovina TaxID=1954250 RepID=A0AA40AJC7_9PEZI|nr:major facilitator superfamily domain-containing protein [Lasiosphaeria miniovina]KAK0716897.1 major facilitator superfamily domain-containing protein [Lasiosphaeria miniovina]